MKIEYGRNSQSSFMRVLLEGDLHKIEEAMLSRNDIDGLLETMWQKEDRGYVLRYDITGKQALDVMLENTNVDERLLSNLIQEICSLCRRLERFLLSQDGLMLEPEMIYWDSRKENFYFCYYPGENGTFQNKFIRLMEYLLTKTDHKNIRAVEMVYGVYETLLQEGDNVAEIQYNLEKIRKSWKEAEEKEDHEEMILVRADGNEKEEAKVWDRRNVIKRVWGWFSKKLDTWIKTESHNSSRYKKKTVEFVFEPEEEPEKVTNPTVLLSMEKGEVQGILRYEGDALLKDIHISKIPFLIGSEEGCDGIIEDVTISRKHALITKVDEVYFIEDMNSSNGTRVGGEFITYKTKISLKKNDVVQFANQRYRFV